MIIGAELGVLRCDFLEQDPERDREGLDYVADSFAPGERGRLSGPVTGRLTATEAATS